jgi:beta-mannosidase
MDLSGAWRAAVADDALRRRVPDDDLDDSDWAELPVPGHWRAAPEFATSDGPVVYRRRFVAPRLSGPERRAWLTFDGIFYQGDVWLDGAYLGDTEGYFFPHTLEVTAALTHDARTEHLVAVEVACPRPEDPRTKRTITGEFQHGEGIDESWNPGGIWRPVTLTETGPVHIARLRVLCPDANAERATLALTATLDAAEAMSVEVRTTVRRAGARRAGPAVDTEVTEHVAEHRLGAKANQLTWRIGVDNPALWWPHGLGGQPLHDVTVEVTPLDGTLSDRHTVRTGLRQVRMKRWIVSVNGERLFLKGSNLGPTRRALAEATTEEIAADVTRAREAGLDLLRLHAHISRPELYDAADEQGMLLWQDFPLQGGYAGVRRQAIRQAREAVDLLAHHPSLAVWCGHNLPLAVDVEPGQPHPSTGAMAARTVLPTWNKTVLDRSVKRALEKGDGSRPVIAHSGVLPHPAWGTDTHSYLGWHRGDERDFPAVLARFPVLGNFVTEFGAQAVPESDSHLSPRGRPDLDWPNLDWTVLEERFGLQKANFDRYVAPDAYPSFAAWRDATQAYQATVIKHHIETLRRLKYRPTGGFCQYSFADGEPAVSWAVLDHHRVPKAGFHALVEACAPLLVVADRPDPTYRPGHALALDVHVVNDLRRAVPDARVDAVLIWAGGEHRWWFEGDIPPDSCVRVGTLQVVVPDAPGPLTLTLDLESPAGKSTNRYDSSVAPTV